MKKLIFLFVAISAFAAFVATSGVNAGEGLAVGATLDNFTMADTSGAAKSLNDLKGKNGAVLVFLSTQCPVVRGYNERINALAADYAAKGINVIGVNANSTESVDAVKKHAEENYKFPVLIDKGNVLADKLGASVTPETFYLNDKNVLMYRGAIDNSRAGDSITQNFLRDALDATLAGKTVVKTSANAFGCQIRRAAKN